MAYTTIDKPDQYFNTLTYTGNGTSGRSVTGVGFQPNWVWIKNRSDTDPHKLFDVVRGVGKSIKSNSTDAEVTNEANGYVSAFGTDGFTLTAGSSSIQDVNLNNENYVSWNWRAGTSFTNDASSTGIGDIDSSGSVNTDVGFSIITATSDGASNKDIAHGLGAVPDVIFAKNLVRTYNWDCYFKTLGYNASLVLNETNATRTGAWGSNTFTTTTFETANDYSSKSGEAYIYYCFAEKKGYSKFGSYTGNGSDNGPFVWTGFKPAFLMIKSISAGGTYYNWGMWDNKRSPLNVNNKILAANRNDDESNASNLGTDRNVDFLSNGFKQRRGISENYNASGVSYMYMAFAENPFVTSEGVPATAR